MMTPPMQPVLQDDAVLLRPMAADDFDALFAVAADPLIWAVHPAHDRWKESVFRAFFEEGLASNGSLVVIDQKDGAIIGHSRYDSRPAKILPGSVEIGWTFLARSHWGGEWNRRIKRLMIGHAFDAGYDPTIFIVGETNIRSRRAMEKIGGVLMDRRNPATMAGVEVVHVMYRIDSDNFRTGPLSQ